ncbi:MAG: T9SS type A sorting domain-containing protein [Candidatus Electryonea clarkiae]|nr:T9SS type A sorting domain-containing protein [Candidatus Electryonea clarkiae]MDP8286056.1 T9SS type A sorting domain-containing protein [Candidatus Electryonea clarkiae]
MLRFVNVVLILLFIAGFSVVTGNESRETTGITGEEIHKLYTVAEVDLAKIITPGSKLLSRSNALPADTYPSYEPFNLDGWILLESVSSSVSVPAEGHYALRLDLQAGSIEELRADSILSDNCWEAIERAPEWMRNDLIDNLIEYGFWDFLQEEAADVILNAEEPYVDEVAYTVAHLSPQLIITGDMAWDLGLIADNAEDVYASDEYLDYVQINDYGTVEDGDYWSTAEYSVVTPEGDTTSIEIDRDIYYMYVVHPRISDEAPRYINPATGQATDPPEGKFWRDYFLNEADEDYTSLRDMLEDCGIMYGNMNNNNTEENGAVGLVTRWIQDIMEFGSGQERPIQPVRIYGLHLGRCGEHQDITAAAARAALIPALGTCSFSEDHVWNEFFTGTEWQQWEPVNGYVNNPLAYQGWGKHFPAVFNWVSDGTVWTVTQRYHTETTNLAVQILDAEDNPVDGVKVKMISDYLYGGMQFATCGYTDSDGNVEFSIGGGRNIYLAISGPLGRHPNNQNAGVLVVEDSDTEVEYEWTYNYEESVPTLTFEEAELPQEPSENFHLDLSYEFGNEVTTGIIFSNSNFVSEIGDGASVDVFVCDEENYELYFDGDEFEAYTEFDVNENGGNVDFTLPEDGAWYVVFSNDNRVVNRHRVDLVADLYVDENYSSVSSNETVPLSYALHPNYPNPFNGVTNVSFSIASAGDTALRVYNIAGREVLNRQLGTLASGAYSVPLVMDDLASGVYFCELNSGSFSASNKMLLLK